MSTAITGNLISLDFTNISNVTSDVNIFSFGSSFGATDTYFTTTFAFYTAIQFNSLSFGSPTSKIFDGASISVIVNDMNAFYSNIYKFTYELVSGTGIGAIYRVYAKQLNINYTAVSIVTVIEPDLNYYYFSEQNVIYGSTVAVTSNSELSYNEISNDLQVQPYIIDSINVYANTISQVDTRWKKITKNANGLSATDFNQPRVDPMQKQFAIENIQLNFIPSSINNLGYRLNGLETVRVFFYYRTKDQFDLGKKQRLSQENFNTNTPILKPEIMIHKKQINIPLIDLTKERIKTVSVKEKIAKEIKPREISEAEVFSAFDGVDYKEI